MLEKLDLNRRIGKKAYRAAMDEMEIRLGGLQRRARELGIPVLILFEGWGGAGKGTQINNLIQCLDPRGFTVFSIQDPNEEEELRPFLWRFWTRTPASGRIAVFDRSWYRRVLGMRVSGNVRGRELDHVFEDIDSFERQLVDDGTLIVKVFLHIDRDEQKKRFKRLRKKKATRWRVR